MNGLDRSSDTQPTPVANAHPCAQDKVMHDMAARKKLGIRKYGTALQPFNGRDSLQDAYEEVLDLAAYLANLILERVRDAMTSGGA